MKLVPRRLRGSLLPVPDDMEDFFTRLWGEGDGDFFNRLPEVFQTRMFPAVNVAEMEDAFTITMDCPGLDEKDIQVEAMGNTLLLSGERKWEEEKKGKEFRRVESQYGKFERTVTLPDNVRIEPGKIDAMYEKGVLHIRIPKLEKTPTAKIPVHAR